MKTQAEDFFSNLIKLLIRKSFLQGIYIYRLNQLGPDNFEITTQHIINILRKMQVYYNDQIYLQYLTQKIIEKSQTEPKYRKIYTKLCLLLMKEPELTVEKQKYGYVKNQFLNQVQQIYDDRKNKKENLSHIKPEEREQYHISRKQKIMGYIHFIGELFLSKIIPIQLLITLLENQF
ncbi:unnamed protein product [Paramecium sonneborni]|uniref:MIF4G domain-containing protein n=1 Tax=Paramecium sonneborni TaxID=65129 RepID=A0A8S1RJV2_9CILI|nr:unnamed protein product [Paramecium sonneborni]